MTVLSQQGVKLDVEKKCIVITSECYYARGRCEQSTEQQLWRRDITQSSECTCEAVPECTSGRGSVFCV